MLIRKLKGTYFRGIKPKSKPLIYDYTQVDRDNPHRPIDDNVMDNESKTYISSFSFYIALYFLGGYTIYFFTRLSYDYEWDRYYHVNHPALMQNFDYLSAYYVKKRDETIKELPSGLQELYRKYFPEKKKKEESEIKPSNKDSKGVEIETKIAEEIQNLLKNS